MDDAEAIGQNVEEKKHGEKGWKSYSFEEYAEVSSALIHFSSKTVNSNTKLSGVRITEKKAWDAPYVSVRTLMSRGVRLALDYGEGGAKTAGVYAQMRAVLNGEERAKLASAEEKNMIREEVEKAYGNYFTVGTDFVDHRLRQVLLPCERVEEGFVAVTPITSGGLCEFICGAEKGLVSRHNKKADDDGKHEEEQSGQASLRRIRQGQFGIGGSNPQNIGGLVRAMQKPLFIDAPRTAFGIREALFLYHHGLPLDFSRPGSMKDCLLDYARFRSHHGLDNESAQEGRSRLDVRQEEERLLKKLAEAVLSAGDDARGLLLECADRLPERFDVKTGRRILVAESVASSATGGLLEPELRDGTWPRRMALAIMDAAERALYLDGSRILALDVTAGSTVAAVLEAALR